MTQTEPGERHADGDADRERPGEGDDRRADVERDAGAERQAGTAECRERADAGRANRQGQPAATRRHQQRLGEHLPNHVDPAGSQGLPHGQLLLARTGPHEPQPQQVHGADDQQHQHASLHEQQDRTDGGDVIGL